MAQKTDYTVKLDEMAALIVQAAGQRRSAGLHTQVKERYAQLFDRLYHDFITPIEREDIARIGQGLCRLAQSMEFVCAASDRYRTADLPCEWQTVLTVLDSACQHLQKLLSSFWHFRKENGWWKQQQLLCADMDRGIGVCREAVAALFRHSDALHIRQMRMGMYADMELCFRQMAEIADAVEVAVLKNI